MTRVLKGSGLSSSAAFEVLVVTVISHLYNEGRIDPVTAAIIAQYAENVYFGKPSGLLDQMACSVGGFTSIDFKDPSSPVIEKVDFDFSACGPCSVRGGHRRKSCQPDRGIRGDSGGDETGCRLFRQGVLTGCGGTGIL